MLTVLCYGTTTSIIGVVLLTHMAQKPRCIISFALLSLYSKGADFFTFEAASNLIAFFRIYENDERRGSKINDVYYSF